jgi:hypothetical protein
MRGKKYSKNADPEAVVGGPILRAGISLGEIVSRFSQMASGRGAEAGQQRVDNEQIGGRFWSLQ